MKVTRLSHVVAGETKATSPLRTPLEITQEKVTRLSHAVAGEIQQL